MEAELNLLADLPQGKASCWLRFPERAPSRQERGENDEKDLEHRDSRKADGRVF